MKKNILITGGTGKTGRRVGNLLSRQGHHIRVGSRQGQPPFDWNEPRTYEAVLRDMDRAYLVYYPDLAVPGSRNAIKAFTAAALEQGLEKVVLLSGKGEREAEACEAIVATSGLNYTIVRASWFNQNFSESFLLDPIQAGQVALPMADTPIPFVDAIDIAEVVVRVLTEDKWNGQTITVTGPRTLTFEQAISMIAKGTGRSIAFQPVSIKEYRRAMEGAGLPDDYVWLLTYLFTEVLGNPDNQAVSNDIEKVLGRPATDFNEYVARTSPTGVWHQGVPQSV